ncbi:MAG: ATP synthase F1 subunit delta [Bacteroidales bacterium]
MKEPRVANRYAKALFDLAKELKVIDEVEADCRLINSICRQNHDFMMFLRSPVIKETKKMSVMKSIFETNLHTLTFRFLLIITRHKRERIIDQITEQFSVIYKKEKNILPAVLTSAVEVDSSIREKIISLLESYTKASIELTEELDERIIGGFVLDFGDMQYDASILRKIKDLRKEFDVNLYIKGF